MRFLARWHRRRALLWEAEDLERQAWSLECAALSLLAVGGVNLAAVGHAPWAVRWLQAQELRSEAGRLRKEAAR